MVEDSNPRPGTTASVEKRLERVEDMVHVLDTRVAAVELNLKHAAEVNALQYANIDKGQTAILAALEGLDRRLDAAEKRDNDGAVTAAEAMSNPMATPAGQQIMTLVNDFGARLALVERKVWMAAGALALILFLSPIIAPSIRALFHLP